jgi:hypothetical protein
LQNNVTPEDLSRAINALQRTHSGDKEDDYKLVLHTIGGYCFGCKKKGHNGLKRKAEGHYGKSIEPVLILNSEALTTLSQQFIGAYNLFGGKRCCPSKLILLILLIYSLVACYHPPFDALIWLVLGPW